MLDLHTVYRVAAAVAMTMQPPGIDWANLPPWNGQIYPESDTPLVVQSARQVLDRVITAVQDLVKARRKAAHQTADEMGFEDAGEHE